MNCWLINRNGTWYIKYRKALGLPRRSLRTKDRRVAEAILAKENNDLTLAQFGLSNRVMQRITYSLLVSQYLDFKKTKGRKSDTIIALVHAFNNFGKSLGRDEFVEDITTAHVENFERERREAGRAPKTIRNELSALKSLFAWAVAKRYAVSNPLQHYELPKREKRKPRDIKPQEYLRLIQGISDQEFLDILNFYFLSGVRRGEGTAIRISEHVDMQRGEIIVHDEKEGGDKIVYITPQLRPIIQRLIARAQQRGDDMLINRSPDALTRRFARLRERLKLPATIKLHGARHTAATALAQQGADLWTIKEFLGHHDAESTKRYVNPFKAEVRKAAKKLRLPKPPKSAA
jgi:site-specific recombinase XerD